MASSLVVLSADWCGPCAALKKGLKAAGIDFKLVDVDAVSGSRLAEELSVASIPAVFVKHGGEYTRVRDTSVKGIRAALDRHA